MLVVDLESDDFYKNDAFVMLGNVPSAIARVIGSANQPDAERKIFHIINTGVQLEKLHPLNPENLMPLSKSDYGIGIVFFDELVEWGIAIKKFEFRRTSTLKYDGQPPTLMETASKQQTAEQKPWLTPNPNDPDPAQPWYIPARYFARQLVKEKSTLLNNRSLLASKVAQSLMNVGIKKRGDKKPLSPSTILKAFSNMTFD